MRPLKLSPAKKIDLLTTAAKTVFSERLPVEFFSWTECERMSWMRNRADVNSKKTKLTHNSLKAALEKKALELLDKAIKKGTVVKPVNNDVLKLWDSTDISCLGKTCRKVQSVLSNFNVRSSFSITDIGDGSLRIHIGVKNPASLNSIQFMCNISDGYWALCCGSNPLGKFRSTNELDYMKVLVKATLGITETKNVDISSFFSKAAAIMFDGYPTRDFHIVSPDSKDGECCTGDVLSATSYHKGGVEREYDISEDMIANAKLSHDASSMTVNYHGRPLEITPLSS